MVDFVLRSSRSRKVGMGGQPSKHAVPYNHGLGHIGEAHAVTKHPSHSHHDIHGVHHPTHTGHEGVVHQVMDWSNELFSRRVQEGDTLWHLSERYLGDGNKWPYLQDACDLDRDPRHLLPGRPITHHCISKAREEAKHHHHPFHRDLTTTTTTSHVHSTKHH